MAHLLVVEDDPDQRRIRQLLLEQNGHRVWTAADAEEALRQFRASQPETVLMDLRLPQLADGLSLIREMRAFAPAVRIIVLSGDSASLENLPEAALVNRILSKPVATRQLLKLLAT